jgi:hypothetical protein
MDTVENQKSESDILRELKEHFAAHRPHQHREELLEQFLAAFEQHAPITTPEVAATDDAVDAKVMPAARVLSALFPPRDFRGHGVARCNFNGRFATA